MDVIELLPRLHLLRFPVGQAYLWRDDEELTLIDAGPIGAGRPIADAVTALGHEPWAVRRVVLTHFHEDHVGGAGEFAALSGAEVLAHHLDAPFIRGERPGPPPRTEEWERPLHAAALAQLPPGPRCRRPRSPSCPTAMYSASAVAPGWCTSPGTRTAASRCSCPRTVCCSPATRWRRHRTTGRRSPGCSTWTGCDSSRRYAGWRTWARRSRASGTATRCCPAPPPCSARSVSRTRGQPTGTPASR